MEKYILIGHFLKTKLLAAFTATYLRVRNFEGYLFHGGENNKEFLSLGFFTGPTFTPKQLNMYFEFSSAVLRS